MGQDSEFISEESSDDESHVVTLKSPMRPPQPPVSEDENNSDEEEDPEFRKIMQHNYRLAGFDDKKESRRNDTEARDSGILDQAVNRFQEVFINSGFMETTSKMQQQMQQQQRQLVESQKKLEEQAKELERVKRQSQNGNRGKSISNPANTKERQKREKSLNEILSKASDSELTIYRSAVENLISKRDSTSSSEDGLNLSDEIRPMEIGIEDEYRAPHDNQSLINQFISDARERQQEEAARRHRGSGGRYINDGQQPSTSGYNRNRDRDRGGNER